MNPKKAFSLVELSIIIFIISMLLIGYMAWTTVPSIDDGVKYQETRQKMRVIHKAIENFIAMNKRLPCAGSRNLQQNATYNISGNYRIIYDDEYLNYTAYSVPGCDSITGMVPTRALGLPADYVYDGWGRQFQFRDSYSVCDNNTGVGYYCTPREYRIYLPILRIFDQSGTNLVNDVLYTLTSMGSNGYGAYLPSAIKFTASVDADEIQNANNASLANPLNMKTVQKPMVAGAYDDIVEFRTKEQIDNASTTASPATLISQADCAANSAAIASLDTATMASLASAITVTRRCITTTCGSGTYGVDYDNGGDEAAFGILWAVQDACYELYGGASTLTRSCTSPWTSFATSNSCCPTKFGQVAGRAVNCGGATYLTDINACSVVTYAQGVDCWIGN